MRFSRRKIRNSTPFRPMVERLEERAVPAIITVNSVADNDVRDDFLTLREAIMLTDRDLRYEDLRPKEQDQVDITVGMPGDPARTDIINFNIGNNPDQVQTITLTNDLPAIKHTVRINGYTQGNAHQNTLQYGDDAVILVVIDGARHDGIAIRPADDGTSGGAGSTIWGLAIVNMGHAAIVLATDDNSIQGNFLGTSDGITRAGNLDGIDIFDSSRNEIGGVDKSDRNIISGNRADGVLINGPDSTSNRVLGNYIGTEVDGVHALANGDDDADPNSEGNGVKIEDGATSNSIGALTLGSGNVISGNKVDGILIDGSFTDANRVAGNFIGLDKSGQIIVANGGYGIEIRIATPSLFAIANEIGATPSPDGAGRNVISGNGRGGILLDSSDGTVIQGNYIGTNKDGTEEKANVGAGILLVQSSARIEQNVISGNTSDGVNSISNIPGPDTATTLSKNYIGTTADGTGRLGNHRDGVAIAGGGQFSVDSNVISANDGDGVSFRGVSNSSITNNYIGRDKNGNGDLHNGGKGIRLDPQDANKTSGNKVIENKVGFNLGDGIYIASGPDNDVESNWVFANHGSGIVFDGTDASGQSLIGNFVGVDDQGDTFRNLTNGVCVNH